VTAELWAPRVWGKVVGRGWYRSCCELQGAPLCQCPPSTNTHSCPQWPPACLWQRIPSDVTASSIYNVRPPRERQRSDQFWGRQCGAFREPTPGGARQLPWLDAGGSEVRQASYQAKCNCTVVVGEGRLASVLLVGLWQVGNGATFEVVEGPGYPESDVCPTPEGDATTHLPNIRNHSPNDTESHATRLESWVLVSRLEMCIGTQNVLLCHLNTINRYLRSRWWQWGVTPCSLAWVYRRFGEMYCLHLQDGWVNHTHTHTAEVNMIAEIVSNHCTGLWLCATIILLYSNINYLHLTSALVTLKQRYDSGTIQPLQTLTSVYLP